MKVVLGFALLYVAVVAFLARKKLHELHPRRFFLETWREVDRQAAAARAKRAAAHDAGTAPTLPGAAYRPDAPAPDGAVARPIPYDFHPLVAYIALAVVLTLQEYFGQRDTFEKLRDRGWVIDWGGGGGPPTHHIKIFGPLTFLQSEKWSELLVLAYWVVTRVTGYVVVPAIIIWIWRERIRDYGLRTRGFLSHAWIYALFFGIVLVAVVLVSQTNEFATYYPFYRQANRSWGDFFAWEAMYAFQFFALELFFRGFLLFSSEKSLGSGVIMAMVVPYCMIHFGKPWLEALAAIMAGTVLGTLALKTRSIWSGFLIHVTVAVSMDMAALLQTRGLPGGFRLPVSWNF